MLHVLFLLVLLSSAFAKDLDTRLDTPNADQLKSSRSDGIELAAVQPADEAASSGLTSISSWLGGVSNRLYSRLSASLGQRLDVTEWQRKLQKLVPKYETAPSSVISRHQSDKFEVRHYAANKWICTSQKVTVDPVEPQTVQWNRTKTMFNSLFLYFSGHNERREKLPMTLPIINKFDAFSSEPSYEMCFLIPLAHQQNTPQPVQPELRIVQWPDRTFISRRFQGLVLYRKDWDKAAFDLEKLARDNNMSGIDFTSYYSVFYDPPVKFWNRKNEIWFEITG